MKVGINEEGIVAEKNGRTFLKRHGIHNLQQIDWLYKHNGKYKAIEVKARELFNPPPFLGTGADIRQIELRRQLYNDLGIDTILLVFEKGTNNIYYQSIKKLMEGKYFDTRNNIRIFPIENFIKENAV
jgi:hypothetical protein